MEVGQSSLPKYKLCHLNDDGITANINVGCKTITVDNRWVIPYSWILLNGMNCHLYAELSGSVKAIKYLLKYINQGSDRAVRFNKITT